MSTKDKLTLLIPLVIGFFPFLFNRFPTLTLALYLALIILISIIIARSHNLVKTNDDKKEPESEQNTTNKQETLEKVNNAVLMAKDAQKYAKKAKEDAINEVANHVIKKFSDWYYWGQVDENEKLNGYACIISDDGEYYGGIVGERYCGYGVFIASKNNGGLVYKGEFSQGYPNGYGQLENIKTRIVHKGLWQRGEPTECCYEEYLTGIFSLFNS